MVDQILNRVEDFEFAACRRPERLGESDNLGVVEVEAGDGEAGTGLGRLFFEADGMAGGIEFDDAVSGWVLHGVGEDGGAALTGGAELEEL